jgi:hypothetical protein
MNFCLQPELSSGGPLSFAVAYTTPTTGGSKVALFTAPTGYYAYLLAMIRQNIVAVAGLGLPEGEPKPFNPWLKGYSKFE